jgi:1,2-dihydroxy-3-keto-5-methylthiopentene dioxygenase
MRAYYFDGIPGDQRESHDSGREVSFDELRKVHVLPYPAIQLDQVNQIAKERGYKVRMHVK